MTRFFVPRKELQDKKGSVSGPELDHMRRVLRLRPGDRVTLFDDEGWEHEGVIRSYTDQLGEVEILTSFQSEREPSLDITLAQALGQGGTMDLGGCALSLFFGEEESRLGLTQLRAETPQLRSLLLVIGPEGGFSSEEASEAMRNGFKAVRLGRRILRTETAALAALSIVQFLWGDMG